MKRWFLTPVLALVSCIPIGTNPSDALFISDLRFESNFRDTSGRSYICDNKLTTLTYSFRYNDFTRLARWDARLVGETTGQATHTLSMSKDTGGYTNQNNRIAVNWVLSQGTAPLSVAPQGHRGHPGAPAPPDWRYPPRAHRLRYQRQLSPAGLPRHSGD